MGGKTITTTGAISLTFEDNDYGGQYRIGLLTVSSFLHGPSRASLINSPQQLFDESDKAEEYAREGAYRMWSIMTGIDPETGEEWA